MLTYTEGKLISTLGTKVVKNYVFSDPDCSDYEYELLLEPLSQPVILIDKVLPTLTQAQRKFYSIIKRSINPSTLNAHKLFSIKHNYQAVIDIFNSTKSSKKNDLMINVDHIIPISFFDFDNIEHILACWDSRNLRLCTKKENEQKSNKIRKNEVEYIQNSQFLTDVYTILLGLDLTVEGFKKI
jgi:HNH endonuclease